MRMMKPGNKASDIAPVLEKIGNAYNVKVVRAQILSVSQSVAPSSLLASRLLTIVPPPGDALCAW